MRSGDQNYAYTTPPPNYRLPAELNLGAVTLQVGDLARSVHYYERVIGLRVIGRETDRASLGATGSDEILVELHENPSASPMPRRGRLGLYHFALLMPNRESLARLLVHLTELGEHAGMSDHFVSEALYLTDPDGLGIEVYADRPRSSWRVEGSNLGIGSAHLDAEHLARAAGSVKWEGMPKGTRIGHVHLYVDNLSVAEKFYHATIGFDKVRLEFPGALFMSAGGYHHHLGTNTWAAQAPRATGNDARLLEWTIGLPSSDDLDHMAASLMSNGFDADRQANSVITVDPWGTSVRFKLAA